MVLSQFGFGLLFRCHLSHALHTKYTGVLAVLKTSWAFPEGLHASCSLCLVPSWFTPPQHLHLCLNVTLTKPSTIPPHAQATISSYSALFSSRHLLTFEMIFIYLSTFLECQLLGKNGHFVLFNEASSHKEQCLVHSKCSMSWTDWMKPSHQPSYFLKEKNLDESVD